MKDNLTAPTTDTIEPLLLALQALVVEALRANPDQSAQILANARNRVTASQHPGRDSYGGSTWPQVQGKARGIIDSLGADLSA